MCANRLRHQQFLISWILFKGTGPELETVIPRLERGRILPPMLRTLQLLLHSPKARKKTLEQVS
jgi:hypothetical protein